MHPSTLSNLVRLGRFRICYADRLYFAFPGLYLWTGTRHVRILPLPSRYA